METKANYLIIGILTLVGLAASLVFVLWLAKVEVERQYAYYEILFENVSGLGSAGDVRYNGLPVGQVIDLRLDPDDPSKVRVRIEVDAATPVKTDTEVSLQGQGVTGVSFVGLSGGSQEAEDLPQNGILIAKASPLQSVLEGAPELLQRAVTLLENVDDVVNEENRAAIGDVLENLASASGRLDRALEDFEALSANLGDAAQEVTRFSGRLDALAETAEVTLTTATDTLQRGQSAFEAGEQALLSADETLKSAGETFAAAQSLIEGELTDFASQGTTTAAQLQATLDRIEAPALAALDASNDALREAEQTFASANRIFDEDIEAMIGDVRSAVTVFRDTVSNASGAIDSVAGEVLSASQSASAFAATLEQVVVANERQLSNFLRLGLPEFLGLTEEARQLVRNLDRFVDRLDRDPARYFFGTQGSEFNR
ncbi:MAG: MlaD family protein [Roseobacter sp.]